MENKLPEFLRSYFWDVDFEKLTIKKNAFLIIKRILDRGKTQDIRWILKTYSKDEIKTVVQKTKDLSRPTAYYWANRLDLDPNDLVCLQKPYSPIHFGLSS